jgi:hypothetical protein
MKRLAATEGSDPWSATGEYKLALPFNFDPG